MNKLHWLPLTLALLVGGCGTMPVDLVSDTSNTSGTHVTALLPLGNETLDNGGIDHIAALTSQIAGVTRVQIFDYYQTQAAADAIDADPASVKEAIIGFSCGANASPVLADGVNHRVDVVAVIQVSEWCGITPLSGNVLRAQETLNENCWDTGGLGCGQLVPGPNFNPSNLTLINRPDCHICSDHDPDAVNDIVLAVKAVTSPAASRKFAAILGRPRGHINVITRYHGQPAY